MKVLVVDDDPVILALTEAVLKGLSHEVITRDRALGTSAAICEERPDRCAPGFRTPSEQRK